MTIYYLDMTDPNDLNEKPLPAKVRVVEIEHDQPEFNKFLYQLVGNTWQWFDKLGQSDDEWRDYVCREELRTWVAYVDGAIAGYFELEKQEKSVEIQYFGLTEAFIGQGIGGGLLSTAIKEAWNWQSPDRVYVNTCTKDHPSALKNYQARGLAIYKTVED